MKKFGVLCVGSLLWLTGCSTLHAAYDHQYVVRNHDQDYLQSRIVAPLKMPANIQGWSAGDAYPVPGYNGIGPRQPLSLVPPGSLVADGHQ